MENDFERILNKNEQVIQTYKPNKLKIYWSPETEQHVLGRLAAKNPGKDAHLLAQYSQLTMEK